MESEGELVKPGALEFQLNFKSYELLGLDLPVEVRRPNMSLVARTLSSQLLEVEPGDYFVVAVLPAGQEMSNFVKVGEGKTEKVILSPEPEDESPHESHELSHYFLKRPAPKPPARKEPLKYSKIRPRRRRGNIRGGLKDRSAGGEKSSILPELAAELAPDRVPTFESGWGEEEVESHGAGAAELKPRLRVFAGNVLLGALEPADFLLTSPRQDPAVVQVLVKGQNLPLLTQFLRQGARPLNFALPAWVQSTCSVVFKRGPGGIADPEVQLAHHVADLLLRYQEQSLFEQAVTATQSSAMNAKELLRDKAGEPIAAAVGAYALLRLGSLELLHNWTENLMNLFTWLPDGVAIRGEHLARLGDHDAALDVFLGLSSRGLPLFSEGLSYVTKRLRLYDSIGEKEFDADKLEAGRGLLADLQRFVPYVDFGSPILTYTGLDPTKPDGASVESYPKEVGMDVSAFFT